MKLFKTLLRKTFKISLFISSYIPLYILIFIQDMEDLKIKSMLEVYKKNDMFWNIIIIISMLSIISLVIFFNGNHTKRKTFKGAKSIDGAILDYFITYIIPLNTIDFTKSTSIIVNLMIFCIIAIYYVESDLMYLNILLIFLGYKVFEDDSDNIIISRKDADYLRRNENILCKKIGNTKIYIVK